MQENKQEKTNPEKIEKDMKNETEHIEKKKENVKSPEKKDNLGDSNVLSENQIEKEFNELKELNKFESIQKTIDEANNRIADLESKLMQKEKLDNFETQLDEMLKDINISKKDIKNIIGFESVQSNEELKSRVEAIKNTLKKNGAPVGVGKSDQQSKRKKYEEALNKKYKTNNK